MGIPLRILIVEDDEDYTQLLLKLLRRGGYSPEYERVDTAEAMRNALDSKIWDIITCDYVMPDFSGPAALRIFKKSGIDLPFIIISGKIDEDTAVECMRAGAHDFVLKENTKRLIPAIKRELREAKNRQQHHLANALLKESETQFRSLANVSPVGIFRQDIETKEYLYANYQWAKMAGISPEDALGLGWKEAIHPEDRERVEAERKLHDAESLSATMEYRFRHQDMSEIWVLERVSGEPDDSGKISCIVGTVTDITDRKQFEIKLRHVNWALRALSASNSGLVHSESENHLFRNCCEAIAGTGIYPLAWIGLIRDAPSKPIEIIEASGPAIAYLKDIHISWADTPFGQGPGGKTIRTGAIQVANDLQNDPLFKPWQDRARQSGLSSCISLPIKVENQTIGILAIYSGEIGTFSEAERDLFKELAEDVGFGMGVLRTRRDYEKSVREREEYANKVRLTLESAIAALAATVEQRDPYTAGHQRRVADISVSIGRELGLDEQRLEGLRVAGTVHDIGKIHVPAEILVRPGKLGELEFKIVSSHAQVGYDILKNVDFPWPVAETVWQHHERIDGSGYPRGLKGKDIIFEARILAVADTVEAMTTDRPYRPGLGIDTALAQIQKDAGTKLDSAAVDACVRLFKEKGYTLQSREIPAPPG